MKKRTRVPQVFDLSGRDGRLLLKSVNLFAAQLSIKRQYRIPGLVSSGKNVLAPSREPYISGNATIIDAGAGEEQILYDGNGKNCRQHHTMYIVYCQICVDNYSEIFVTDNLKEGNV